MQVDPYAFVAVARSGCHRPGSPSECDLAVATGLACRLLVVLALRRTPKPIVVAAVAAVPAIIDVSGSRPAWPATGTTQSSSMARTRSRVATNKACGPGPEVITDHAIPKSATGSTVSSPATGCLQYERAAKGSRLDLGRRSVDAIDVAHRDPSAPGTDFDII